MRDIAETITVAGEGLTLSLITWRKFRRPMPGYVELICDMNPRLPQPGSMLPVGTMVRLPAVATAAIAAPVISLWD